MGEMLIKYESIRFTAYTGISPHTWYCDSKPSSAEYKALSKSPGKNKKA